MDNHASHVVDHKDRNLAIWIQGCKPWLFLLACKKVESLVCIRDAVGFLELFQEQNDLLA